jgi:glutathione synthase/RimK-type ligase-like ATP-grasp enzyme
MDTERHPSHQHTVAILSRGDAAARRDAAAQNSRFGHLFEALAAVGIEAQPAIYDESFAEDVREQLLAVDGVLVWVNPIQDGRSRVGLDALLRNVAAQGVWVSAHPDVILKMGTKEVLYRTRSMGWGSDTALYETAAAMRAELPARLATGPRVIKRNRGNGGQGVWKVESLPTSSMIKVLDATKDAPEELTLDDFLRRCAEYFENGSVIDQPFQPRLSEGVVRCYMAGDRCAGFGYHKVKALVDSPDARSEAGPRLYTSNADSRFQRLRRLMEDDWTAGMMKTLDIDEGSLPVIWDADFLYGPKDAAGADTYVLCEINASSCFAIPEEAPAAIARTAKHRLSRTQRAGSAK